MNIYDELKKDLTDAEQKAINILISSGWQLMREAFIDDAVIDGFRHPTYTINGRYFACIAKRNINREIKPKPKKRGRPPKEIDERGNCI